MSSKPVIALLYGGRSSEHSISCATAAGVLGAIDHERFDTVAIGITRAGAFIKAPDDPAQLALKVGAALPQLEDNGTRVHFPAQASSRDFKVTDTIGNVVSSFQVDLVFPLLHGRFGEDGTIQGMLELLELPFVGSGTLASALAMDKHFTKVVLKESGIPVVPWGRLTKKQWRTAPERARQIAEGFGWPVFVKPARAGSSVGVSRVAEENELAAALEVAFAEDSSVLIEPAIVGRELEVAMLEGRDISPARASVVGEIVTNGGFYDFDTKYRETAGASLVCPAELDNDSSDQLRAIAAKAFDVLGCAGLARIDFFLGEDGPLINEVNTLPGFTPISMFPRCWEESGLGYRELITELIELGLDAGR